MGAVVPVLQAVGTVTSVLSSIQGAQQQAADIEFQSNQQAFNLQQQAASQKLEGENLRFQAAQLETQRLAEETAASQAETERSRQLNETLSTIDAIRASRGLTVSPTAKAITRSITDSASADIRTVRQNRSARADTLRLQSKYAGSLAAFSDDTSKFYGQQADATLSYGKSAAKSALRSGYGGAFTSLLTGAASFAGSSLFPKTVTGGTLSKPIKFDGMNVGTYRR